MTDGKTLLLTGGSSGIGLSTVEYFVHRGWLVYELSRHGVSKPGVKHIDCDVTNDLSVQAAITQVMADTDHIDVLISNAGFGISGPIEFTAYQDAQKQFDVNFFGALRITQAILPLMRKQKQGRIIFTSSVAALLSIPYQSFYSASKAAINAMALALQNEVRDWNIHVSVLMPGDVATGFTAARQKAQAGSEVYTHLQAAVSAMEKDEQTGMQAQQMAKIFYHIATCACPAPQYIGGAQYKLFCFLDRLLPKRLVNWIVGKLYS